ncbi:hypothetical protein SAMN05421853_1421 [Roseivivax halotolerans]|uniref:Uncharacterized protein n=1 Tax=Roseivivax halotolerans TaxID=93684 RepID=A0A1I6ARL5_9RHOB|nr:hypothetical protein [Roseivivax halotolerans]SFQ71247.1 hypothetical protein SAMN05421853_1421 [Roseivivax halotolerans]
MFDFASSPLIPLASFMHTHSMPLQNASLLLGGAPRLRETQRLIEELSDAPRMTRRLRRSIDRLYELLTLEHVHEPERSEAAFFALIDPEWPMIEEICLLSDGLLEALTTHDAENAQAMGKTAIQ